MNNRLLPPSHRRPVVFDPLHRPLNSLGPPIRIRVESPKIDVLELELGVEVAAVGAVVRPIVTLHVETAFAPGCHEVVRIKRFDVRAHLVVPSGDRFGRAVCRRAGQVPDAVCAAAGFVGEFPGEDRGVVFVAGYEGFDVAFEGCFDLGQAVELFVGRRWILAMPYRRISVATSNRATPTSS